MTLHGKKKKANIVINKEKRQIQHTNSYRRNLQISEIYHFVVLQYKTINSGKHYWEVDMSRRDARLLGLNRGPHAAPQLCSMNEMFSNVKFDYDDIQHEASQLNMATGL